MLNLGPRERQIYEQLAKGRDADHSPAARQVPVPPPALGSTAPASNGKCRVASDRPTNPPAASFLAGCDAATLARLIALADQGVDLMTLLRFDAVTDHARAIKVYYLFGCACKGDPDENRSRSCHQIASILKGPPTGLLAAELPVRVRASLSVKVTPKLLSRAIHALAVLLTAHFDSDVRLAHAPGPGLPFEGLTEAGDRLWRLIEAYLRKTF